MRPAGKHRRRDRWGFTAIELAAVASIIAILALILIPIVRQRIRSSRVTAALDDMRTIEIAETFARADTGQYFRLMDLDNGPFDDTALNPLDGDRLVPRAYWNKPISPVTFPSVVQTWNGPYTTFNVSKFERIDILLVQRAEMFRILTNPGNPSTGTPPTGVGTGPILVLQFGNLLLGDDSLLLNESLHPMDPWGGPYIFFGDGPIGPNGGPIAINLESNFSIAQVYSMGPDGVPGDADLVGFDPSDPANYFRETGALGTGDDLVRRF